jgi:hypothetical protein
VLMVLVFISGIPVCATSRKICIDYNGTWTLQINCR